MKPLTLLFLALCCVGYVRADSLTLWNEDGLTPGEQFGVELCDYNCTTGLIAELGPFVDTGRPQSITFAGNGPAATAIEDYIEGVGYVDGVDPVPYEFIEILGAGDKYNGVFANYPPPNDAIITGFEIVDTGGTASYEVEGTNLVPEPPTWMTLSVGIVLLVGGYIGLGALLGKLAQRKRRSQLAWLAEQRAKQDVIDGWRSRERESQ